MAASKVNRQQFDIGIMFFGSSCPFRIPFFIWQVLCFLLFYGQVLFGSDFSLSTPGRMWTRSESVWNVFVLEPMELWKAWNPNILWCSKSLVCNCIIGVLGSYRSWFDFFPHYILFSQSIGKVISVVSPSRMQQQRRLGSRFTSMSLEDLQTAIN